jgi:hypothetical protein
LTIECCKASAAECAPRGLIDSAPGVLQFRDAPPFSMATLGGAHLGTSPSPKDFSPLSMKIPILCASAALN